jgi:soluble lytic murein transglycosylase-like protein
MIDILSGLSPSTYNAVKPIAQKYGVPDFIWETIAIMESNGNPNAQNASSHATGLFQLMPNGGQADNALRDGHSLEDLKNPALNAQYGMPSIARAYNQIKGDANFPDGNWWIKLASLSGHPYENGDMSNGYSKQLGLEMKKVSEGIAASQLSAKYDAAWKQTGNVGPIDQAINNLEASAIAAGAPPLQAALDGTKTITDFIALLMGGGLVKIGLFLITLIFVVIGFVVIGKGQVLK